MPSPNPKEKIDFLKFFFRPRPAWAYRGLWEKYLANSGARKTRKIEKTWKVNKNQCKSLQNRGFSYPYCLECRLWWKLCICQTIVHDFACISEDFEWFWMYFVWISVARQWKPLKIKGKQVEEQAFQLDSRTAR